jgi:hypothetical protein
VKTSGHRRHATERQQRLQQKKQAKRQRKEERRLLKRHEASSVLDNVQDEQRPFAEE